MALKGKDLLGCFALGAIAAEAICDRLPGKASSMSVNQLTHTVLSFGPFEADLQTQELKRQGVRLRLPGQSFQILAMLVQRPGQLISREELHQALWPSDTFIDFEKGINAAINRLREALGDSAENPQYVETLPRRGYRFISDVTGGTAPFEPAEGPGLEGRRGSRRLSWALRISILFAATVLAGTSFFLYKGRHVPKLIAQRALTRLTFEDGLQSGVTWSPDNRFIAYSSDRGGKSDIWVRQISGGDPVQITKGPGHNWQPDWSPDGKYIVYRSESGEGGLFVVPALGGEGLQRRVATFGFHPRWSPDGSHILFRTTQYLGVNRFYVVALDGSQPHEVLTEFTAPDRPLAIEAAWHPDGRRISVWVDGPELVPDFRTVPLAGGVAVKSEVPPEVARQLEGVALEGIVEWTSEFAFSWAPSGRALYFPLTLRGAVSLWKMTVDPVTLRATAIERVTTGPGPDAELDVSPDGRKLAFTEEFQHIQTWLFPFDASRGSLTGVGRAVTPPGMSAWRVNLSRDGEKLAFSCNHAGRSELWEMSLVNPHMTPVVADDQLRDYPVWSPDGKRLVYSRYNFLTHDARLVLWSPETRNEEPISDASYTAGVYDWSPDHQWLLVSQANKETNRGEIWLLPIAAAPNAEAAGRKVLSDSAYDLSQPHFSRDGRWIVFQAVRNLPTKLDSRLYVTLASGGPWIPLTEGKHWDDKPRWSPNGRMIYFVSGRTGFFNVWGIHFDPAQGKPVGEIFPVTKFSGPALMIPLHIPSVDLSLNQDHLVLTVEQVSGSVWMLENVD
jgi:Tol biopolymer transport system component/DNA-binding winged helix-turn-helix (wHTH) protein